MQQQQALHCALSNAIYSLTNAAALCCSLKAPEGMFISIGHAQGLSEAGPVNLQAAQSCNFAHTHGYYGENLFASSCGPANWTQVISDWASEAPDYNPNNAYLSSANGHFTQLIWKSTRWIGCAWHQCASIANLNFGWKTGETGGRAVSVTSYDIPPTNDFAPEQQGIRSIGEW